MAKSTRTRKSIQPTEEKPKVPEAEPPIETNPKPETPIQEEEKEIGNAMLLQPFTDVIEDVKEEIDEMGHSTTPVEIVKEEPTIVSTPAPTLIKPVPNEYLSFEERILKFLDSRSAGEIRMNDFLKSLFPIPKFNEPPAWLNQGASKRLRVILEGMERRGEIYMANNVYRQLGSPHYPDTITMKTEYHNLNTIQIIAVKK